MSEENTVNEELTQNEPSEEVAPEMKESSPAPEESPSFESRLKSVISEMEANKPAIASSEQKAEAVEPPVPLTPKQQFAEMLKATAREEGVDSPELQKMCDKLSEVMTQSVETNKKNAWLEAARSLTGNPDDETLSKAASALLENPIMKNIGLSEEQKKALSLSLYAESVKNRPAPASSSIPIPVPVKSAPKSQKIPADLLSRHPQEVAEFFKKMRS